MYDPPEEIQYIGSSYEQSYVSQDSFYGYLFVKHKLNISLKVNINNHSLKGSVIKKNQSHFPFLCQKQGSLVEWEWYLTALSQELIPTHPPYPIWDASLTMTPAQTQTSCWPPSCC